MQMSVSRMGANYIRWQKWIIWMAIFAVLSFAVYFELSDKRFFSDVYAWFPDGQIKKVLSPPKGIYYTPQVHPKGTHVVFFWQRCRPATYWED